MLDTIKTIWLREIKKFFANRDMIITSVLVPVMSIFIIGTGLNSFVVIPGFEMDYVDFFGPGVIAALSIGAAMFVGFSMIRDKQGYIKELMVTPISRNAILIGKILGEVTSQVLTLVVAIVFIIWFADQDAGGAGIAIAIVMMALIVFGFSGFGVLMSSIIKQSKAYNQINTIILIPMIFLSGAFFPISALPDWLRYLAYIDPLTYGVDGIRSALIGVSEFGMAFDLSFLIIFALAMIFISSLLFGGGIRKGR